jgi:type II secretory pathway component PulC
MRLAKWIIVFLMLAGAATFAADDPPATKYTYDNYKVVYERNMFSKDRLPPREVQRTTTRRTPTTTVLSIYVLRGVAAEAGRAQKFAFIEEQISGESSMAWIGTKILDGRIKDIRLNYVLFEEDGKTRIVRVGEEFGKASSTVMEDVAESADGNETADDAPQKEEKAEESTPADESDILKKLLERRQRELGT